MKKILSIDGGGIKGIFAASFLARIEEQNSIRICEYFDIIAGTSTGGIIAAALALGIPADEILRLYLEKGNVIFPANKWFKLFRTKYKSHPLQAALEEVFGARTIKDCKTRLLIPAYNIENGKTRVFKTTHAKDLWFDKDVKIVDCLLSTTAAPLYFKPYKMTGGIYIDGGVGANNPSLIALIEGISRCQWDISDISLLSIGEGEELGPTNGKEKMGIRDAITIQKCFMSAESQYADNICKIMISQKQYYRINQLVQKKQISMDKVSEESVRLLENMGITQAMERNEELKHVFFKEKKEEVHFYNLKG